MHNVQTAGNTIDHWLRLFEKEQVQFIVLNRRDDGELVKAIHSKPEWIVDFEDDQAVIFAMRRNAA
ncbi:MAG: hypothetical protein JXA33_12655 [Anaerolineae bacterium]|nr:hypothetical protein [Anaerolineae bacterium]